MLDTIHAIETPEGVELDLRLSGIPARMMAWIIDSFIRLGLYIALSMALAWADEFGLGLYLIMVFLVEWFYPVVFEVLSDGMTPGKRAMGIRVIHANGTPVGWSASVTRNLLRFVDFLPLFYVFGVISIMLTNRFQRLGDLVAGTLVIYREQDHREPTVSEIPEVVPAYSLQPAEAQAIVNFAERANQISSERADELASTTGKLLPPGQPPAKSLLGIARWIQGN